MDKSKELHAWVNPIENIGLGVYQYGYSACEPGHAYGPAVRDHFLIHIVKEGNGTYATENQAYTLGGGKGFLIFPGHVTGYRADTLSPWSYYWIGFMGSNAEALLAEIGLTPEKPIFSVADIEGIGKLFERTKNLNPEKMTVQLELTSILYAILSRISPLSEDIRAERAFRLFNRGSDYAASAKQYIRQCYASNLTIGNISERLGLERTYFSALFKKHVGVSPQAYLISVRMEKARELLTDNSLSVSDVARTVGYEDPLLFSRIFRKHTGLSPKSYRTLHIKDTPSGNQ